MIKSKFVFVFIILGCLTSICLLQNCTAQRPVPPSLTLEIDVEEIGKTNLGVIFHLSQDPENPHNVSIVNVATRDTSIIFTSRIHFSQWGNEYGRFVSVYPKTLMVQSFSGEFPNEEIISILYLGSNVTLRELEGKIEVPTFILQDLDDTRQTIKKEDFPTYDSENLVSLRDSYTFLYEIQLIVKHSSNFQTSVFLIRVIPIAMIIISMLLLMEKTILVWCIKKKGKRLFMPLRLPPKDRLSTYVTLLLFTPVFIFSLSHYIPVQGVIWVENWISNRISEIVFSCILIIALIIITIVEPIIEEIFSWIREELVRKLAERVDK